MSSVRERFRFLLTLVLLVVAGAAAGENEYGVPYPSWWRRPTAPRPDPAFRRFDRDAFDRWAAAQPPEAAPVVDFLRNNLNHVTQQQFEAELGRAFDRFLESRTDSRPLLFVTFHRPHDVEKSGAWTTMLLRERYPEAFRGAAFYNLSSDHTGAADMRRLGELARSGNYRVVVCDDAMYSGRQMLDALLRLAPHVRFVDVVVPFATKDAAQRLRRASTGVTLHSTREIPTIFELIAGMPQRARERLLDALGGWPRELFTDRQTLTYFDHKHPDFFSFPHWVAEGLGLMKDVGRIVLRPPGSQVAHPFLRTGGEPYKIDCVAALAAQQQAGALPPQ